MVPYLVPMAIALEFIFHRRSWTRLFAFLFIPIFAIVNSAILVTSLGECSDCDRPCGSCVSSNGMPSGHATNAIGLCLWLILETLLGVGKQWKAFTKAAVCIGLVLLFVPVPYSRVYLGDHTELQVGIGSADGVVFGLVYFFVLRYVVGRRLPGATERMKQGRFRFLKMVNDFYIVEDDRSTTLAPLVNAEQQYVLALLSIPVMADTDSDDSVDYVRCTSFEQCCAMWGEDSKRCERGPCTGTWIMRKFFSLSMPLDSVTFWEVVCTFYSMVPYLVLIAIIIEALVRSRCYTRVFAILLPIILTVLNTVILVKVLGDCDECPRPAGSCLVSNGLPSGHATNAIGLWTWVVLETLVGVGERVRRWSMARKAVAVFFATLLLTPVPYSRYFLGDHTALQVAVGSADGFVLGVAYFFFIRWQGMHRAIDTVARVVARYIKVEIKDDFYLSPNQVTEVSGDDRTIADDSSESENAGVHANHAVEKEIQTPYVQA
ncbi:Phosphatidic acid phosphatase [Phytophthora palmivora]|uniref:Phosphatidic acid phosphatase n=1 Tax=Phytophthora palmivora TaxID=4796 RepID=A0A2P4YAW2_9STRA|nr:Phosphatidic acid phosphatase [Phytophthora palmivora]